MIEGGCLCGAIRYELSKPALQTSLCHCEDCRKASGAPAVAWTFFHSGALEWVRGKPKVICFAGRERTFCGDCGTPLMFFDPGLPHIFEVSTCSLDEADAYPPGDRCWMADAPSWFAETNALPGYVECSPVP